MDVSGGASELPRRALTVWIALVGALIALAYVSNAGSPDADLLYRYSTAIGAVVQYALISGIVVFASRGIPLRTLGFVRPSSWLHAGVLTLFGGILAWLRWHTASLYPPIILHALFNATALLTAVMFGGGF